MLSTAFVFEVGRNGIENLYAKGYSIAAIARIYGVSETSVYSACHELYGVNWKTVLKQKAKKINSNINIPEVYYEEQKLCTAY